MKFRLGVFTFLSLCYFSSFAADTLTVSLQQADSIFLTNNYYLLASSMNIEAQKAQILQAKLYPNPTFTADLNAYDPQNHKIWHVGKNGQKAFQLEQLIILAGKRRSEIELSKLNAEIALLEFQDMVRQLKYRLHKSLFSLTQQQYLLAKYNTQLSLLDTIMARYEIQIKKGNIPLKDLVRLKGVYFSLNNDRAELQKQYFEAQAEVQSLLQTGGTVVFRFPDSLIASYVKLNEPEELINKARINHPYLKIARQNELLAKTYLQYQKRLAIPDVSLFSSYDQRGGAFERQINAGITIPLPFWNRNQGNIKSAQYRIKEAAYTVKAKEQELLANVQNSYELFLHSIEEYQKASKLYSKDFEITLKGVADNFQRGNISMLEFVDFFEAYNEAIAELARIKTQLLTSAEQLNLNIGIDIF